MYARARVFRPSRAIEIAVTNTRVHLGLGDLERVDALEIFEDLWDRRFGHLGRLSGGSPGAHYPAMPLVEESRNLGSANARVTFDPLWDRVVMVLSNETYAALRNEDPAARMDVAHELGHLVLHEREVVERGLMGPRGSGLSRHPNEWSVEQQAEQFGLVFLAPSRLIGDDRDAVSVARRFGLPRELAKQRLALLMGKK